VAVAVSHFELKLTSVCLVVLAVVVLVAAGMWVVREP